MATPTTLPASWSSGQVLTASALNNLRGAFRILQVASAVKTDTFTTTSTSFVDITGLSVSITPSATSSLILATYTIKTAVSGDIFFAQQLVRGSTAICIGDAAGSRSRATTGHAPGTAGNVDIVTQAIMFLDSPATTSATTYKVQGRVNAGTGYINRQAGDSDSSNSLRLASTITVFEVSA